VLDTDDTIYTVYLDKGCFVNCFTEEGAFARAQLEANKTQKPVFIHTVSRTSGAHSAYRITPTPPKGTQLDLEF
jgi:hypothetical protein